MEAGFLSYTILILIWTGFGFMHSLLANNSVKHFFKKLSGYYFGYYRLAYNLFNLFFIAGALFFQFSIVENRLFELTNSLLGISILFTTTGLIIMFLSIYKLDLAEMSGTKKYKMEKSGNQLVTEGLYKYIRHPLYFGTILLFPAFIIFAGTLSMIIMVICFISYLLIAIPIEEKKLEIEFGLDYTNYKKNVKKLIPFIY
ncbi:MAG: isoprenylcysteine carboxylmethyltransferase family protein [Chitinophagaceae bacterium]|nr:MAG: isoprenylcysteine carboxylmethyltransferase family protein [Chitinophagaceae bacterium]